MHCKSIQRDATRRLPITRLNYKYCSTSPFRNTNAICCSDIAIRKPNSIKSRVNWKRRIATAKRRVAIAVRNRHPITLKSTHRNKYIYSSIVDRVFRGRKFIHIFAFDSWDLCLNVHLLVDNHFNFVDQRCNLTKNSSTECKLKCPWH